MKKLYCLILMLLVSFLYNQNSQAQTDSSNLLKPDNLKYIGAFKLPSGTQGKSRWGYGGTGLTYYPSGDPDGGDDGYPGSLFGIGHDWHQMVSEISIPVPVNSKDYSDLNSAVTLQPFNDITGGLLAKEVNPGLIQPDKVGGLTYLPPVDGQPEGMIYWNIFKYYHVMPGDLYSHGRSRLDLSAPQAEGLWRVGNYSSKKTANYMFTAPKEWADQYLDGKYIITGRGDGAGNAGTSHGPAMYAIAPYKQGNPPPDKTELETIELLMYPASSNYYPDWTPCDEWNGGAWLTSGNKSAVVIVGLKGLGTTYYGIGGGNNCFSSKGYHCDPYEPQLLFYSPQDLADVAAGTKKTYEVLPYAIMNLSECFMDRCAQRPESAAFDSKNGILYVVQGHLGEKPVVHVFKIINTETTEDLFQQGYEAGYEEGYEEGVIRCTDMQL